MSRLRPDSVVNIARYPVHLSGTRALAEVVTGIRSALDADGCAVLPGFLTADGLSALTGEARDRIERVYYSPERRCNVYFDDGDTTLAPEHPRNRFLPRTNGFITADCFGPETCSRELYAWAPLASFLARCLGRDELFVYDDPVSNMIVNVSRQGQEFNWHFDTNEFTITLLLQAAETGGDFEYVPALRTPTDERYDAVGRVLDGDRSDVRKLNLQPGDLQLFLGRYALHRVSPCHGETPRLLLIMSFTEVPGVIGSRRRVQTLYGKTMPVHHRGQHDRVRADGLLD